MSDRHRLQLEVSPKVLAEIDIWVEKSGVSGRTELLRKTLDLWVEIMTQYEENDMELIGRFPNGKEASFMLAIPLDIRLKKKKS